MRSYITLLLAVLLLAANLAPALAANSLSYASPVITTIPASGTFTVQMPYTTDLNVPVTLNVDILNPSNSYSWHGKGTVAISSPGSGTASVTLTITAGTTLSSSTQYLLKGFLVATSTYTANPNTAYLSATATAETPVTVSTAPTTNTLAYAAPVIASIPASGTFTVTLTYSNALTAATTLEVAVLNPSNSYSVHAKTAVTVPSASSGSITVSVPITNGPLTAGATYLVNSFMVATSTYTADPNNAYTTATALVGTNVVVSAPPTTNSLAYTAPIISSIPASGSFSVTLTYSNALTVPTTLEVAVLNPSNSYSVHAKTPVTVPSAASGTITVTVQITNGPLTSGGTYLINSFMVASSTYSADPNNAYATATALVGTNVVVTGSGGGGGGGGGGGNGNTDYAAGLVTRTAVGTYSYSTVLGKSFLFYEAQRSGALPANNRIPWRGNSNVNDGSDVGRDLSGGLHDAGDFVKFNFPQAFTLTTLAWGMVNWPSAYSSTGQADYARSTIRWIADYFVKCHAADNVLYGQVGDGVADHASWDRVERMTMARPSSKIDASHPGSDLAGETAAGLAAASIVFRGVDNVYADSLLAHARTLFNFANTYRGLYSQSMPAASGYYVGSFYYDELAWAAAWLYKATGEASYLSTAQSLYSANGLANRLGYSWEDKSAGVSMLLLQLTNSATYQTAVEAYVNSVLPGGSTPYTSDGLVFIDQWGSLRHAHNAAFIALSYADWISATQAVSTANTIKKNKAKSFAINQLHYALGDSGRSFVIGYGVNYPQRPHHREASCPSNPSTPCGWNVYTADNPAPNILNGALVGGPKTQAGLYIDSSHDYQTNEVAVDYNAAFTGVVARLAIEA